MRRNLLIIGASGHGIVVADIAIQMSKWDNIAFLDDNPQLKTSIGLKVIGTTDEYEQYITEYDIFIAIGNNEIREKIYNKLEKADASVPILIHPSAVINDHVEINKGTVIMAGAIINSCTKIGKCCIVNTGSTIDHDNFIEDFVHISPGVHIAGTVEVSQGTWLGIGSVVSNNVKITSKCIIGAGAVVVKNISESGTYLGVPARRVNE